MSNPQAQPNDQQQPADDIRSALEAAIEQEETSPGGGTAPVAAVPPAVEGSEELSGEDIQGEHAEGSVSGQSGQPAEPGKPADGAAAPAATEKWSVEKPPQSWKAAAKASWATLPLDARNEVIRRERQITQTLGESAQARQFTNQFLETVRPFEARIRSANATPLQAVDALLKADHLLMTAPQPQRAEHMAKLILDYGIDFKALDDALATLSSGRPRPPSDGTAAEVDRLVAQRLAPLQQFVNQQQQLTLAQQQAQQQEAMAALEKMAQDDINFPHFEAVRQDMADIIEINARRGVNVDLKTAYARATAMNPNYAAQTPNPTAGQQAHARARRALSASVSVGGSPSGTPGGGRQNPSDLRGTLEAAFASVGASR